MTTNYLRFLCNKFARQNGRGKATKITIQPVEGGMQIGEIVKFGYRKYTTGEYVPKNYLRNFGWKNTYYQSAVTEVIISPDLIFNNK
jgi:hypothetical protein